MTERRTRSVAVACGDLRSGNARRNVSTSSWRTMPPENRRKARGLRDRSRSLHELRDVREVLSFRFDLYGPRPSRSRPRPARLDFRRHSRFESTILDGPRPRTHGRHPKTQVRRSKKNSAGAARDLEGEGPYRSNRKDQTSSHIPASSCKAVIDLETAGLLAGFRRHRSHA